MKLCRNLWKKLDVFAGTLVSTTLWSYHGNKTGKAYETHITVKSTVRVTHGPGRSNPKIRQSHAFKSQSLFVALQAKRWYSILRAPEAQARKMGFCRFVTPKHGQNSQQLFPVWGKFTNCFFYLSAVKLIKTVKKSPKFIIPIHCCNHCPDMPCQFRYHKRGQLGIIW